MSEPALPLDPATWSLRPMTEADLATVRANEERCHPDPWNQAMLKASLSHAYCCVLEQEGTIRGHGILALTNQEAELLNLCIQPAYWGQGLGRALLRYLLRVAEQGGAKEVLLEVRRSNQRAIRLYESEGFVQVGTWTDYYQGPVGWEDALIMARSLEGELPPLPFAGT